jgi:hypothetical protein
MLGDLDPTGRSPPEVDVGHDPDGDERSGDETWSVA